MVTYKPIPIGLEADEYWRAGLLYFYSSIFNKYVKDVTTDPSHAPTRYRHTIQYAICVEE